MVLAMKLITFAWNIEDGRHSHEVGRAQTLCPSTAVNSHLTLLSKQELDLAQDGNRVEQTPSLLRFLGFW